MSNAPQSKIEWVGTSQDDIRTMPEEVRFAFGMALRTAQRGGKHPDAKPLKGYTGAGVLEIVEDFDGNTYRAVYTVKFAGVVYVLHVFQKKSTSGIKTQKKDLDLIEQRLKTAAAHFAKTYGGQKP